MNNHNMGQNVCSDMHAAHFRYVYPHCLALFPSAGRMIPRLPVMNGLTGAGTHFPTTPMMPSMSGAQGQANFRMPLLDNNNRY